jgi:hypothetical protein
MINFLTQLKLDEISSVDKGANSHAHILLMKRAGAAMSPADALALSIQSGLDDDDIKDKNAWRAEQTAAYNDFVAKGVVDIRKGATMSVHDETIRAIAKNVCEANAPPVFAKADYISAIARRADEIRKAKLSTQQSFARAITQDDVGNLLYRASKFAKGPEVELFQVPNGSAAKPWPEPGPSSSAAATKIPPWSTPGNTGNTDEFGPANKEMNLLASDHAKANPRKSKESAYAHVYTHPNNVALREACKDEERKFKIGKVA